MWKSLWGVTLGSLAGLLKDVHNSDMRVHTCENKPFMMSSIEISQVLHTYVPWPLSSCE